MVIKDVMRSDVLAVRADASLSEALDLLARSDEGVVAVYDEGEFLGTLTEHDIASWLATPGRDVINTQARDVVSRQGAQSSEDQDVREAARQMKEQHVSGLVVLRDHQPVGAVSLADLVTLVDGDGNQITLATPQIRPAAETSQRAIAQAAAKPSFEERRGMIAPPARVYLQPIAAPSVLGLFSFAGSFLMLGAYYAGWFGTATSPEYIGPFLAIFGGLAQLLAGMWAFKARDGLATAIHGTWGAFFLAYGILYAMVAGGSLSLAAVNPDFGWWFIPLGVVTGAMAIAAIGRNISLMAMLLILCVACICAAFGILIPSSGWLKGAGYVFMVSAIVAFYQATALLMEDTFRRVILPLGKLSVEANIPGTKLTRPTEYRFGEPGVRAGQ